VLLAGASAWLECSLERAVTVGCHDVSLLAMHDLGADASVPPLVVHGSRYTGLLPISDQRSWSIPIRHRRWTPPQITY
jgi:flavin reductase (DIM6/NTAB) family NADH-FMN oxidoreductase RutF